MERLYSSHQPTLRQILDSEAMTEAQIVHGDELLDRPVVQVVASLNPPPRAGSLVVTRVESLLNSRDSFSLKDLSAVVIIKSNSPEGQAAQVGSGAIGAVSPTPDVALKRLTKLCVEAGVPLVLMPSFGEPGQVADDVRMTFLREVKQANARLHALFLSVIIDDGIEGLVEELSTRLNRPVAIETADFKVLASRNMGITPVNQQRMLMDEVQALVKRNLKSPGTASVVPIKAGRRLVLPIILAEATVGYLSIMVRPNDDLDMITDYLQAAAAATMVEFSQRRKDGSVFSVTQKSLLKDLLSGRGLSASDQERLERHYGFDMCDCILVFAIQAIAATNTARVIWPEDGFTTTEVEGTRVYLLAFTKNERPWQEHAQELISRIRSATKIDDQVNLQVGAAREVETLLELPEAYREARQSLIIGNMVHEEKPFIVEYGELGVKRLLYLMIDHPEFDRFYEETLEPLEAYDKEWESELVPSLRVYLAQGANLNSTARELFIHRHTLRYRLEQIAEILKVDIDSQEVLLNLQIAFLIADLKGIGKEKS